MTPEQFAIEWEAARPMLLCAANRLVRNKFHNDAEDLVQDAAVKAFTKRHTFRGESNFSTWAYKIVFREFLMHARANKNPRVIFCLDDEDTHSNAKQIMDNHQLPDHALDTRETQRLFESIRKLLPNSFSQIIWLQLQNEGQLGSRELAKILAISESAAKSRTFHLRERFLSQEKRHVKWREKHRITELLCSASYVAPREANVPLCRVSRTVVSTTTSSLA